MKKFELFAANETHPHWDTMIKRELPLYPRPGDLRTPFGRDYTRIIHSTAYRRLKHKTQVFFSPENDHICTRIEHVTQVESISYTISQAIGLNTELTKAIAVSHDLGHSPFGHVGEHVLSDLSQTYLGSPFWHEKNGLTFVDDIELLEDVDTGKQNLNLTYAVRDGIISHCGEIDENSVRPREEAIDLLDYVDCADREARKLKNRILFSWENESDYLRMIISYISGMTDHFAMEIYHEIIHF